MSVDVFSEITITRPRELVADYAENPNNAPSWYVNIKSVEWKSPPPLGIGSKIAFVAHFLGKRMAYTYEIAEYIPRERLVMRTAEGPFPMETTYTWEAATQSGTRMTLRNRGNPWGFSRLVAPFMAMAMRRANRSDLECLKALLEKQLAEQRCGHKTTNPSIERLERIMDEPGIPLTGGRTTTVLVRVGAAIRRPLAETLRSLML